MALRNIAAGCRFSLAPGLIIIITSLSLIQQKPTPNIDKPLHFNTTQFDPRDLVCYYFTITKSIPDMESVCPVIILRDFVTVSNDRDVFNYHKSSTGRSEDKKPRCRVPPDPDNYANM